MAGDTLKSRRGGAPLLAILLVVAACGARATDPSTAAHSGTAPPVTALPSSGPSADASPSTDPGSIVGSFDIGGRSLHLACVGRGSPTIILEPGDGDPTRLMQPVRDALSGDYRVCLYDRANKQPSDPAPTPRPAKQIAEDLERLLDVAAVPGPYLPVGTSLGGLAAYVFAATHPDDVVGFISINPPPNPEDWLPAVKPLITDQEYADEVAAGDGTWGGERIDERGWLDIATPPDDMPYLILDSGTTQCEGDQLCLKVYDVIVDQTKDMASRGARGRWTQIQGSHQLQLSNPEDVLPLVRQLASGQLGAAASPSPSAPGYSIGAEAAPGTYDSSVFKTPVRFTLPAGWKVFEDEPGQFGLALMANDGPCVCFWRDVRAMSSTCAEAPEPGIGTSARDLATWFQDRPGLVASAPTPVTIGGLHGYVVDVSIDPAWTTACPFSDGLPTVPTLIGSGLSTGVEWGVVPGDAQRLYLLDVGAPGVGQNLVINVDVCCGVDWDDRMADVAPVVASLVFGR